MRNAIVFSLSCLFLAILAGCGGGSGSSQTSAPQPVVPVDPPTPPTNPVDNGTVSIDFSSSNTDFSNPERGFYRPIWSGTLNQLSANDVSDAYDNGHRLMYARIDLEPYKSSAIPEQRLNQLRDAFDLARQGGVKFIVRASYNYPQTETEYLNAEDASLSQVLSHITQLEPVWRENVDVISSFQAGFIGAWGEWHTSSNGLTTETNRTLIRDALLDAMPEERFIQFRYPPYIMDWYPTLPNLSSALDGSFRIGFHNDCFLASATDVGTYDTNSTVQASQRAYTDDLGDLGVFGGETCNPADAPGAVSRTSCLDIRNEGADYNLTYLNTSYYRDTFHDNWIANGCMAEVSRTMGYRFSLVGASHAVEAAPGEDFELSFTVQNSGWARLYNPRSITIILRNTNSGDTRSLLSQGADPREWLPGTSTEHTATVSLPNDLPLGDWEVLLALPDASPLIEDDVRYSIRLANEDDSQSGQNWDATLGAFALGTSLSVE